ncbi:Nop14-like family-domain-containing protein [Amanita rubescens]|nr:Nop14-like family-domain-containing protein [Amanita rubescens]
MRNISTKRPHERFKSLLPQRGWRRQAVLDLHLAVEPDIKPIPFIQQAHDENPNSVSFSRAHAATETSEGFAAKSSPALVTINVKCHSSDENQQNSKPFRAGRLSIKGVVGTSAQSRMAGIEQYEERNHAGGILDQRFGENDPTTGLEERMLERFTRERQKAAKSSAFSLEDEDELTHYGQSLSNLDDLDDVGLRVDEEDEEDENGQIDKEIVRKTHFGGFGDEDEDERWVLGYPLARTRSSKPGKGTRLHEAVKVTGIELCPALCVGIPVGKDSMSMSMKWREEGEGCEEHPNYARRWAKDKPCVLDTADERKRMGGSAVAQISSGPIPIPFNEELGAHANSWCFRDPSHLIHVIGRVNELSTDQMIDINYVPGPIRFGARAELRACDRFGQRLCTRCNSVFSSSEILIALQRIDTIHSVQTSTSTPTEEKEDIPKSRMKGREGDSR